MRTYELVLVVRPEMDEEGFDAFVSGITGMVTDQGGQIVDVEHMGRRRLAYPIKKITEGHYVLLHLNLETPALVELERRFKLSEDVLRYLVIRMDELMEPAPPQEPEAQGLEAEGLEAEGLEAEGLEAEGVADSQDEDLDADDLAAELADELADELAEEPEA